VIKGSKSSVIDISNVMKTIGSGPKVNGEKIESIKLNFRCNGRDENLKKKSPLIVIISRIHTSYPLPFCLRQVKNKLAFSLLQEYVQNKNQNNSNKY
jgi:hypothetical protein